MWYEPILEFALQAVVTLVIGLIGLGVAYATGYIRKLGESVQEKTESQFIRNLIGNVQEVVYTAVYAAEQRVAGDLREAVKDGKVDREELLAVAKQVKQDVLNVLGEETVWLLGETFGDVNKLIEDLIEAAVLKMKAEKN